MGVIDHNRGGSSVAGSDSATTRLLQHGALSTIGPDTPHRHPLQNLRTVVEHEVWLSLPFSSVI